MKINIKEVLIIISLSIFFGFIRYFLLDEEFSLIKKPKLESIENNINHNEVDSLLLYIKNTKSPKLIDITLAKLFYDNNLVTFIDARDAESYTEEHILNALNIPYDLIEDVFNEYDLKYLIELNEDFIEEVYIDDNNPFYFGLKEGNIYLSNKKIESPSFNLEGNDSENDDFTLQDDSPCIDTGTADLDGDGEEDITNYSGLAPDMGAMENIWITDSQLGDLVEDGVINIQDIILMIEFILGFSEPTEEQLSLSDMNNDGLVNVFDVVLLVEIILYQ